jgi:hypothetical protein
VALFAILGVPRPGHAGLADYIWEMSGPELWGLGFECDIWFAKNTPHCKFADLVRLTGRDQSPKPIWVSVEATGYFSTTKDQNDIEFGWFQTWMAGVDPMINVGGWRFLNGRAYHGAGGSFNWLMGDFRPCGNQGWKIRPVVLRFGRWEYAYNLRLYRKGFDGDPSDPDHLSKGESSEVVHGFVVRLIVPPFRKPAG